MFHRRVEFQTLPPSAFLLITEGGLCACFGLTTPLQARVALQPGALASFRLILLSHLGPQACFQLKQLHSHLYS